MLDHDEIREEIAEEIDQSYWGTKDPDQKLNVIKDLLKKIEFESIDDYLKNNSLHMDDFLENLISGISFYNDWREKYLMNKEQ